MRRRVAAFPATDDVAEAVDVAAEHWPETPSRRELLLRVDEQDRTIIERDEEAERRREAIRRTSCVDVDQELR